MALDFTNASVLGYNHRFDFLGEIFNYRITKELTIRGTLSNFNNQSGVTGIWSNIESQVAGAYDYSQILINNINFGSGRITNITFDPSNDVQLKNATYNVECYDSGSLFNLTGSQYNGIEINNFKLIDNLDEEFSYSQNSPTSNVYTHSVNIRLNSGAGLDPITLSKNIAANLFNISNITGFIGVYTGNRRNLYKESYNAISNECSFSQTSEVGATSGNYSISYTNQLNTDQQGITTSSEAGEIKGGTFPFSGSAYQGFLSEQANIFDRCSGMYVAFGPGGAYPISSQPIQKAVDYNHFEGIINYNYVYSNSPELQNLALWSYSHSLDKNSDNIITVSEEGTVNGVGRSRQDKFTNANSWFNTISGTVSGRIVGFYNTATTLTNTLYQVRQGIGKDEINGNINYNSLYTDDPMLARSGDLRRVEINYTDTLPVNLVNKFIIANQKELVQNVSGVPTIASRNLTINMIGSRSWNINDFATRGIAIAAGYIPPSGDGVNTFCDVWLDSLDYSWSSGSNNASLNATWLSASGGSSFNDLIVNL